MLYCLHLQGEDGGSKFLWTVVMCHNTTWYYHKPENPKVASCVTYIFINQNSCENHPNSEM